MGRMVDGGLIDRVRDLIVRGFPGRLETTFVIFCKKSLRGDRVPAFCWLLCLGLAITSGRSLRFRCLPVEKA